MRLIAGVLAGGASRRFGSDKLLADLGGKPLIHHALGAAAAAPVEQIIVAAGSLAIEELVFQAAAATSIALHAIPVDTAEEGLGGSLRTVAGQVPDWADGLFIFLADMPFIPHWLAGRLALHLAAETIAVTPIWAERRGHPVLFGRRGIEKLRSIAGSRGAAALLIDAVAVPIEDNGIFFDVDTVDALLAARASLAASADPKPST